jgi:Lon protease-like protein
MPGYELPLNIFEPRYLNMVNDALATHRMIGMIQPKPGAANDSELCQTGCAGRITQFRETPDGRIEMVLSGVCRFDIDEVLPTTRGYRMIVPNWLRFETDYDSHDDELPSQHDQLVSTARRYMESKGLNADWDAMERLPTVRLMNSLSMALPISVEDKQVLLESIDAEDRLMTFIALLDSATGIGVSVTKH